MQGKSRYLRDGFGMGVVAILAALIVIFAPEEQTLGKGINSVYVHVTLTWTGMLGLIIMGVIGVIAFLSNRLKYQNWAHTLGWFAVTFLTGGFVMSMLAARINWGGFAFDEPRARMAMSAIALTLFVQLLNAWLPAHRLKGLFSAAPATYMLYAVLTTELVLHPQNPIFTSESRGIQFTFLSLFAVFFCTMLYSVWRWRTAYANVERLNSEPSATQSQGIHA